MLIETHVLVCCALRGNIYKIEQQRSCNIFSDGCISINSLFRDVVGLSHVKGSKGLLDLSYINML